MSSRLTFFDSESGENIEFDVIEQTRVNNVDYLLVAVDEGEEESEAYILKDVSLPTDEDACYEIVEDKDELNAVMGVFKEIVEGFDIE